MARIEKTVFISYRRKDISWALAVYQDLTHQGYDVFFDYTNIASGDFEQIILSNIKARAHFVIILTPTALDRCSKPGDWLRHEIELAIDEKRNIIPLFFDGFNFGNVSEKLTGKLQKLGSYNGMNVYQDFFLEAMERLRSKFLNVPLDAVLHPVSAKVQEVVLEEQRAANRAAEEAKAKAKREAIEARKKKQKEFIDGIIKLISSNIRRFSIGGIILIGILGILFAGNYIFNNLPVSEAPKFTPSATLKPLTPTDTLTETVLMFPSNPGIGSAIVSEKDGMKMVFVPAGKFMMGNDLGESDEKPARLVDLSAFWIDQTEVTNAMYANCVDVNHCEPPKNLKSNTRPIYFGNPEFDNYPVIYVDWDMAKKYCEWADRRLPTEAEWEKSARGAPGQIYPWGNTDPNNSILNFRNGVGDTTEVGKYPAGVSLYGALDLAGNVQEWVGDWYDPGYYASSPLSDPVGPDSGVFRVMRGGSWVANDTGIRTYDRESNGPIYFRNNLGFRCSLSHP